MRKISYPAYEEASWELWEDTLISHENRMSNIDLKAYLPSPEEIFERIDMLRWLQSKGFNNRFISGVMRYSHPGIELVKSLEARHGAEETARRLDPFLPATEYDPRC